MISVSRGLFFTLLDFCSSLLSFFGFIERVDPATQSIHLFLQAPCLVRTSGNLHPVAMSTHNEVPTLLILTLI